MAAETVAVASKFPIFGTRAKCASCNKQETLLWLHGSPVCLTCIPPQSKKEWDEVRQKEAEVFIRNEKEKRAAVRKARNRAGDIIGCQ